MAMNYINLSSENQTFYGKDMEPGVVQSVPGPINANDFLQISKAPDADVPDDNTDALAKMIENTITAIEFPKSVTKVGNYGFYGRNLLTTVSIPARITSIGDYGFAECTGLVTIDIPDTCTNIGNQAFYNCSSLASIKIPEGATVVGGSCFFKCSSLKSVDLPDSLTTILPAAFNQCSSLRNIDLPDGLSSIGNNAFGQSGLEHITIPEGISILDTGTFANCQSLVDVTFNSDLTKVGDANNNSSNVFRSCTALPKVDLSNTKVTEIGGGAFGYDRSLTSILFPDTLTAIGTAAFTNCGLTGVDIPGTVKTIPNNAFDGCSMLESIKLESGVTTINQRAFAVGGTQIIQTYADACTITIPSTVTTISSTAFAGRGSHETLTININKASGSITGAPWGATGSKVTINWLG